ncbi:MAG: TspO/MBR family protein [Patescibacteria group bacterium]
MKINFKKLLLSLILPQCAGLVGSFWTAPAIDSWYATLIKPSFSPPNYLFAPVWIILYLMMGLSIYLIWQKLDKNPKKIKPLMVLFWIHLVINGLWSLVFFGGQSIQSALIVIAVLWFMIVVMVVRFWKISKIASLLLIPYLLWVFFASVLNYALWILN